MKEIFSAIAEKNENLKGHALAWPFLITQQSFALLNLYSRFFVV